MLSVAGALWLLILDGAWEASTARKKKQSVWRRNALCTNWTLGGGGGKPNFHWSTPPAFTFRGRSMVVFLTSRANAGVPRLLDSASGWSKPGFDAADCGNTYQSGGGGVVICWT